MDNIFPVAQRAVIEPTIGIQRSSAFPPANQVEKEYSHSHRSINLFKTKPKWFKIDEISEREKSIILGLNRSYFTCLSNPGDYYTDQSEDASKLLFLMTQEYLSIRNKIISTYDEGSTYLPFKIILNFKNYHLAAKIFNFLEDSNIINHSSEIIQVIEEILEISESELKSYKCINNVSLSNMPNAAVVNGHSSETSESRIFINKASFDENTLAGTLNTNYMASSLNNETGTLNQQPDAANATDGNQQPGAKDLRESENTVIASKYPGLVYVKEGKRVKETYVNKDVLINTPCSCGARSMYFSSDLLFICQGCLDVSRYPSGYSARNFHKITQDLINCIWSKREEYMLLKNIEIYGDNWQKVSEGLNKTMEQCIFHFIKMPIIDDITDSSTGVDIANKRIDEKPYVNDMLGKHANAHHNPFPSLPFTQVPNPISTLIAFICSMVYPSISTELAKTAIKYLNNPNLMDILLSKAKEKCISVLENEKAKLEKLKMVEIEAMIKRILLKVDSINEISAEVLAVKNELEDEREKLLDEFAQARKQ